MTTGGLAQLSHGRRLAIVAITLPVIVGLAVLAFAWPTARTSPRDLPVGVVGSTRGNQELVDHVSRSSPGAVEFRVYADDASALTAIHDREIYGAFEVTNHQVRLITASAASPSVAQVLEGVAQSFAASAPGAVGGTGDAGMEVLTQDAVPLSADDPKGAVFSACMLPLTICSMIAAAMVGLLVRFRPAWRQILALAVVASLSGAVVYLVGETYLGAFPSSGWADWGVLALTIFAISASTAGLIALVGSAGLALGAALMVFLGNSFGGVASSPDLLPKAVNHIGQLLPPGAGGRALRDAAYFSGHGTSDPLIVLIAWSLLGITAVVIGHHAPIQLAAYRPPADLARTRPEHAERHRFLAAQAGSVAVGIPETSVGATAARETASAQDGEAGETRRRAASDGQSAQ